MHILLSLLLLCTPALADDKADKMCRLIQREIDKAVDAGYLSEREGDQIMIRCYTSNFK